MLNIRRRLLRGLLLLLPLVASQTSAPTSAIPSTSTSTTTSAATTTSSSSVVDYLFTGNLSNLITAVSEVPGLLDTLAGDGPFTILAPLDEGWSGVNLTKLLQPEWNEHLSNFVRYHISSERVVLASNSTLVGQKISMMNDETAVITQASPYFQINNIPVRTTDLIASNGVVHVLDQVLLPRSVSQSIVDVAYVTPELSVLTQLMFDADDLATVLSGPGPFTVFAPNNKAFGNLNGTAFGNVIDSETQKNPFGVLTRLLHYHAVPGIHLASDFVTSTARSSATNNIFRQALQPQQQPAAAAVASDLTTTTLKTLGGLDMKITADPSTGVIHINDNATIVQADILLKNGVLHIIDAVLFPVVTEATTNSDHPQTVFDVAVQDETKAGLSAFVDAVIKASMARTLSRNIPYTVFVPNDDAFTSSPDINMTLLMTDPWSAHLTNLLSYHVLAGAALYADNLTMAMQLHMLNEENVTVTSVDPFVSVNGVRIRAPDLVVATNGILHVLPQILVPQAFQRDLVEAASSKPELKTMVDLVAVADLVETLQSDGPFTIFAPINQAFDRLQGSPMGDAIAAGGNTTTNPFGIITGFLKYHVIQGLYTIAALEKLEAGTELQTVHGADTVKVYNNNGLTQLGTYKATIIEGDILGVNGVLHIINAVIFPAAAYDLVYTDNLFLQTTAPTSVPRTNPPTLAPAPLPSTATPTAAAANFTPTAAAANFSVAVDEEQDTHSNSTIGANSTTAPGGDIISDISTLWTTTVENTSGAVLALAGPVHWPLLLICCILVL